MDYTEFHCSCICVLHSSLHSAYYTDCHSVCYTQCFTLSITECVTARSREDETQNGHRNAKRNPRWSSQVSFQMAHLKRDLNKWSFEKRPELWQSRISICISTIISSLRLIFSWTGCKLSVWNWVSLSVLHECFYTEYHSVCYNMCIKLSITECVTQLWRCSTGALKITQCYTECLKRSIIVYYIKCMKLSVLLWVSLSLLHQVYYIKYITSSALN